MSNIYVLPLDPAAPASAALGAPVEPAKLWASVPAPPKPPKVGTTHVFYGENVAALTSLGGGFEKKKGAERREAVRTAVGAGVKKVRAMGEAVKGRTVKVDAGADAHAAGALSALLYVAWG